jgi:hypothetical protein
MKRGERGEKLIRFFFMSERLKAQGRILEGE